MKTKRIKTATAAPEPKAKNMRLACESYLRALVAYRDAKAMLAAGFAASIGAASKVMDVDVEKTPLDVVVELLVAKEAADRIELYERDPFNVGTGRTAAEATAAVRKMVEKFAKQDKCWVCEQSPALPCLRRHVRGRSCA